VLKDFLSIRKPWFCQFKCGELSCYWYGLGQKLILSDEIGALTPRLVIIIVDDSIELAIRVNKNS
jgi:hypothetical protein